ncbi:MAG: IS5/IS1182 family transposase, partial [Candidatus Diapherotrites archaeon]|nr:IS5/IS1182 family transposase [Candidatus Diapherotrites archaeon]
MTNRGEYKTSMYGGRHKKYVHVTITVNTETKKILASTACVVGEGDSEPETAQKHMRKLIGSGTKVKKF